jgi:hypothetical protein
VTDWNQDADIGLTFKGYFQIYDGATPFRYKELLDCQIITNSDSEKYYNDAGLKRKKSLGDSSSFQIRIKKSADLYASSAPPYSGVNLKTISYFMTAIINDRLVPEAVFEGVQQTESATNKYVVVKFTGFVEHIDDSRNPGSGVPEVVISGEIKTLTTVIRQVAAP